MDTICGKSGGKPGQRNTDRKEEIMGVLSLEEFLDQLPMPTPSMDDSQYVKFEDASLYIRFNWRTLASFGRVQVIAVSNLSRRSREGNVEYDAEAKSTGFMDRIMALIEDSASVVADGVMIDQVMNEFLPGYFAGRGYQRVADMGFGFPSFFKLNDYYSLACRGFVVPEVFGTTAIHLDDTIKNPSCVRCEADFALRKCIVQNTTIGAYHWWECGKVCYSLPHHADRVALTYPRPGNVRT